MDAIIPFLPAAIGAVLFGVYVYVLGGWAYQDAQRRGKPGWIVSLLVLFGGFPLGLLLWLLFRPEPLKRQQAFDLDDFRVQ